jgi:PHD/YefM family antitoxin component YafN of YafNO toxin-antitoxin module
MALTLEALQQEIDNLKRVIVTRAEFESAMETIAILSNEETMKHIEASERDIEEGNVSEIENVDNLLE